MPRCRYPSFLSTDFPAVILSGVGSIASTAKYIQSCSYTARTNVCCILSDLTFAHGGAAKLERTSAFFQSASSRTPSTLMSAVRR